MAFLKTNVVPAVTKYKGNKATGQEKIQTKKVYGFNVKSNDRSKSPKPTTPLKSTRKQPLDKTPTKNRNNLTDKKVNRLSTTPNKTQTAKK